MASVDQFDVISDEINVVSFKSILLWFVVVAAVTNSTAIELANVDMEFDGSVALGRTVISVPVFHSGVSPLLPLIFSATVQPSPNELASVTGRAPDVETKVDHAHSVPEPEVVPLAARDMLSSTVDVLAQVTTVPDILFNSVASDVSLRYHVN